MKCILLGTGGALTSPRRNNTSLFFHHEEKDGNYEKKGIGLLVDCNGTCIQQLTAANIDFTKIEHIFITHRHIDHIGALGNFMQQLWLASVLKKKPEHKRTRSLNFYANAETLHAIQALFYALKINEDHHGLFELDFHELDPKGGQLSIDNHDYTYFPNRHGIDCFGIKTSYNGQQIIYSGDTEIDPTIYDGLNKGDILIHECNTFEDQCVKGHTSWPELQTLLAELPKIFLYLVHLPPVSEAEEETINTVLQKTYNGNIIFGQDGLQIKI